LPPAGWRQHNIVIDSRIPPFRKRGALWVPLSFWSRLGREPNYSGRFLDNAGFPYIMTFMEEDYKFHILQCIVEEADEK